MPHYRLEGFNSKQCSVQMNMILKCENAFYIRVHVLAYCVIVNLTHVPTNFGNS